MAILFKKYNKVVLSIVIVISSVILFNLFLSKAEIKQPSKANNLIAGQEQILIDKSEDIAALGYSGQRKVAKDRLGNLYIAYRKKHNGYYSIFVAKLTKAENEEWIVSGIDKPVAFIMADQRVPSITIDSQGILHLVWYGSDSEIKQGNRQIKYTKSTNGGDTWDQWKNISIVSGYDGNDYWQEHPNIFASYSNELYVVWEGKDVKNEHQQIKFSKSVDGGQSWQDWVNIGISPNNTQSRPSIVQDSNGKLHVLMYSSMNEQAQQIWHSYSSDQGDNWSVWQNISNSSFDSRHISISIDGKNNLHAVWRAKYDDKKPAQIHYSILKNNKWSKPVIIAESDNNQFFPSITIDKNDTPYIVWMESKKYYAFPKEWPEEGEIYTSYFSSQKGKFSEAEQINFESNNLYPSFLFQTNSSDSSKNFPFIYTKIKDGISEIILELDN